MLTFITLEAFEIRNDAVIIGVLEFKQVTHYLIALEMVFVECQIRLPREKIRDAQLKCSIDVTWDNTVSEWVHLDRVSRLLCEQSSGIWK